MCLLSSWARFRFFLNCANLSNCTKDICGKLQPFECFELHAEATKYLNPFQRTLKGGPATRAVYESTGRINKKHCFIIKMMKRLSNTITDLFCDGSFLQPPIKEHGGRWRLNMEKDCLGISELSRCHELMHIHSVSSRLLQTSSYYLSDQSLLHHLWRGIPSQEHHSASVSGHPSTDGRMTGLCPAPHHRTTVF